MRNIKHRSFGLNGKRQQKEKTGTIVDQPSPTELACGTRTRVGQVWAKNINMKFKEFLFALFCNYMYM